MNDQQINVLLDRLAAIIGLQVIQIQLASTPFDTESQDKVYDEVSFVLNRYGMQVKQEDNNHE